MKGIHANRVMTTYQLQLCLFFIDSGVIDACSRKRLTALHTCGAASAVYLTPTVAGIGGGVVNTETLAYGSYFTLAYVRVWGTHLNADISASAHGLRHMANELWSAVRIYGMVARVIGNVNTVKVAAFCYSAGDGEHYAVAERHHGRFHVVVGIMSVGDGISTLQER